VGKKETVARIKYGARRRGDRIDSPECANFFHGTLRAGNNEPDFSLMVVRSVEEGSVENTDPPRARMIVIRDMKRFDRQRHLLGQLARVAHHLELFLIRRYRKIARGPAKRNSPRSGKSCPKSSRSDLLLPPTVWTSCRIA
jgi:hypothetical protein